MIDSFIEDLLIAHAILAFNTGRGPGLVHAERVVRELPRERLAALWPTRRSRSLS